jgi:predicted permease
MIADLRFALRRLARAPGFSATVVLLLGIAFGGTACLFSVIYGLLYKPLPFAQSDRLVVIDTRFSTLNLDFNLGVSVPYFDTIASHSRTMNAFAAYHDKTDTLHDDDGNDTLRMARVQPALFGLLGTGVAAGRSLADADAVPGAAPVAAISWDLWQNRYGGAADAVGATLRLAGTDYRIAGVLPRGFRFLDGDPQVYAPLAFSAAERAADKAGDFSDLNAIARLADGSDVAAASAELMTIAGATENLKEVLDVTGFRAAVKPLRAIWSEQRRATLELMLLAVALVLVVTLANICNLYIARLLARRHEVALCEALGAGPGAVLRQFAGEAIVLCGVAAGVAIALLPAGLALLQNFDLVPRDTPQPIGIDAATIGFIAVLALIAAFVVAVAAVVLRRRDTYETVKQGTGRQTAGRRAQRARHGLVVVQIALTTALLVGVGLLLRSAQQLLREGTGFDREHLMMTAIDFHEGMDPDARQRARAALQAIVERAAALPGVAAVGSGSMAPFGVSDNAANMLPPGVDDENIRPVPTARDVLVSGDYFAALGLPLKQGRAFTADELRTDAPLAIVDADFVDRYNGGRDPLGLTFKIGRQSDGSMRTMTIIGVVPTVKQSSLDERAQRPTVYHPQPQPSGPVLLVRTHGDPAAIAEPLKQIVTEIAPAAKLAETRTMKDWIERTVRDRVRLNVLLELLGAMALVLAAVGLYAVLAYSVRLRTSEFGVRMALGATGARVQSGVLRQGAALVMTGIALALPLALVIERLLAARLYQVGAFDALTLGVVAALLGSIALVACWLPARRAARVNPIEALRYE